jgi:hypothetical protein
MPLSEIEAVQSRIDLENWKNSENRFESDQDSRLTSLVPALSRLLGWLNEGKTCDQIGMRFTAMLVCIRPDFIEPESLKRMPPKSKASLLELIADFRLTFGWRGSLNQNGRMLGVDRKV